MKPQTNHHSYENDLLTAPLGGALAVASEAQAQAMLEQLRHINKVQLPALKAQADEITEQQSHAEAEAAAIESALEAYYTASRESLFPKGKKTLQVGSFKVQFREVKGKISPVEGKSPQEIAKAFASSRKYKHCAEVKMSYSLDKDAIHALDNATLKRFGLERIPAQESFSVSV